METEINLSSFAVILWILGGIFFIVIIVVGIIFIKKFFKRPELYGLSKEDIQKRWNQIEELLSRREDVSWKLAVLEADKLLDHSLKAMGFGGVSLGERLKLAAYRHPNIRNVWSAHITRNKLAHEASYSLGQGAARQAVSQFKRALQDLGVL
ncbi:hypothetical protein HYW94_04230 [Candidatus Uhrbacteria bacterium]|nr:hypothetical protein [Candidatus Uhrbacteria bacterium]